MHSHYSKRWGEQKEDNDPLDLLAKKDQQIRKLQAELQQERRRADNALKMLQSYKTINTQAQQSSQGLRSEMTRRMKAQQEVKRLKLKNQELQNGIRQLMKNLQLKLAIKREKQSSLDQVTEED